MDALTLERSEIQWDKVKNIHRVVTARQKTGTHVSVPIPANNRTEIRERVKNFLSPEQLTKWDAEVGKAKEFLGQKVAA